MSHRSISLAPRSGVLLAAVAFALAVAPQATLAHEDAAAGKEDATKDQDQSVLLVIQGKLKPGKQEVYNRYLAGTRPLMEKYGVTIDMVGDGFESPHTTGSWPINAILKCPSRKAAEDFLGDPGYQAIKKDRDDAYEVLNLSFVAPRDVVSLGPRVVAIQAFEKFKHGLATGEWQGFLDTMSDDFSFCFPMGQYQGCHKGKEKAKEFFTYVSAAFPEGLKITELVRVSGSGPSVVFEFEDEGLLRGQPYHNKIAISLDVRDDEICGYREYFGVVGPPPEPSK